jgi:uncharacterized protein HemY
MPSTRSVEPDDAEVAKTLGILSYRRDLYPRSVELLTEASGKRRDDAEALYYLGEAHYQLGGARSRRESPPSGQARR